MTTSTRLAFRLTMFALAAVTLTFAFSGVALAAPGSGDAVSPTPHTNLPVYTLPPSSEPAAPEDESEAPTESEPTPAPTTPPTPDEPTLVQPTAEPRPTSSPQPTSAPESQPFATPPVRTTDTTAASQPTHTEAVRVAIGAGLAAVLLGGGWLATSLARVMRQERHP